MNVTAVIPTINEEGTIGSVIDGLLKSVEGIEIIVVDTDSTDRTKEIAAAKGAIVINESRRGIAGEALGLVIEFARKTLKLHSLYTSVLTENIPSISVLIKNGFSSKNYN